MHVINENSFARSPTLETVLMIERALESSSGAYNRTELWKSLPKKVMWQTYLVVLDYLEQSNKIVRDSEGKIVWIWNPAFIRKLETEGLFKR